MVLEKAKTSAELAFTCHHVEVLNHLTKEQIFLVEKGDDNLITVKRLSENKGIRRGENHFATQLDSFSSLHRIAQL